VVVSPTLSKETGSMSLLTYAFTHADHDGPGGWWPIFPILWFAVIVTLVFVARRGGWGPRRRGLGALEERYARGEIDANEYRERRAVLKEKK
jgi:putative membrane protein